MPVLGNWVEAKRKISYMWGVCECISRPFSCTSSFVMSVIDLVQMRKQLLPTGGVATPSIYKLVNCSVGHFAIVPEN
jgi:hypothetical protein